MKKTYRPLLLPVLCAWLAAAATSCSNDDNGLQQPGQENYVTYTFRSEAADTRASVDETDYTFRWDAGDQVSIYMGNDIDDTQACTFTTQQGGSGSADFSYTGPAVEHACYTGFYPRVSNPSDKNPVIKIPATDIVQTAPDNSTHLKLYRAMYTETVSGAPNSTELTGLRFHPLTGLLVFNLKNEGTQTVRAKYIVVEATNDVFYTRAHYAIGSGATTATPDENYRTSALTLYLGDNGFDIAPQTTVKAFLPILPTRDLGSETLTLRINGVDVFSMPGSDVGDADGNGTVDLTAGHYYTFNLSVSQAGEDQAAEIRWTKGILPPADNDWIKDISETAWLLPYQEKYGWIDCNKVGTGDNGLSDYNLCWAASASSLLHWWMNQNQEYIERYRKIVEARGETFNVPSAKFPSDNYLAGRQKQKSDILQHFTEAFRDEGGFGGQGINWFISGTTVTATPMRDKNASCGFFKEVFPPSKPLGESSGGLSKEIFNETVKDALNNGKGLGFSVNLTTGGHAMTIWGVEFDEEGTVTAIYYADNNDSESVAGCIRVRIRYQKLMVTDTAYTTQVQYESSVPGVYFTIKQLFTVSLGQEQWEAFLQANETTNR